jgi:ribosomal protein S18 acetylase RimI-like enzyme
MPKQAFVAALNPDAQGHNAALPTPMIRQVLLVDLDQCAAIEAACYGPEGATRERIAHRIATYPEGFLIAELEGCVIGFVNSGATDKDDVSDETFKDLIGHTPAGRNLVIFSLAVHPDFQRHRIGRLLIEALIATAKQLRKETILLLCQPALIPYYQRFGFRNRGASASTHGGLSWHEMVLPLAGA